MGSSRSFNSLGFQPGDAMSANRLGHEGNVDRGSGSSRFAGLELEGDFR